MKEFWNGKFHRAKDKDADKDRGEENEGEKIKPEPVRGVGDEAFWTRTGIGGALYALKKDAYVRISVGGADAEPLKIKKAKALAQKALKRL